MPIISLASIAVHPLGLEIQERRDANSESYEESNQPVKDHPRLWIGPSPQNQESNSEAQRDRGVPGNSADSTSVSEKNRPHETKPENPKPVQRITQEIPRRYQNPSQGACEKAQGDQPRP